MVFTCPSPKMPVGIREKKMVQVSYPGVYVQEKSSGVHTIAGVATSVAAFFGRAAEGPIDKAVRCLSYSDFEKIFGPPHPQSELGTSVRLFFQNGGTECYVVRLAKEGTGTESTITLKAEDGATDVLTLTAKEKGAYGDNIAIEVNYLTSNPESTFNMYIFQYNEDGSQKIFEEYYNLSMDKDSPHYVVGVLENDSNLVTCELPDPGIGVEATYRGHAAGFSEGRRVYTNNSDVNSKIQTWLAEGNTSFQISVDGAGFKTVELSTSDDYATKENLAAVINNTAGPGGDVEVDYAARGGKKIIKIISKAGTGGAAGDDNKSVVIKPAPENDISQEMMLGIDYGGIEIARFAEFRPAPNGIYFKIDARDTLAQKILTDIKEITLNGSAPAIDLGTKMVFDTLVETDKWYLSHRTGTVEEHDGIRKRFAIIAESVNNDPNAGYEAKVSGSRIFFRKKGGAANHAGTIALKKRNGDDWSAPDIGACFTSNILRDHLAGGADGAPPEVADYKGKELTQTGFYALNTVDIFNIMVIPYDKNLTEDEYRQLWPSASVYCKKHRAFLIIEPPASWKGGYTKVSDAPATGIAAMRIGLEKDYSAVFYPRITVMKNGLKKNIGPGGAIAGLMARTDSTRGVWKAPAGTDSTITGLLDLEIDLTDPENGVLNKLGVNCIRKFPSGIVNWGARTIDGVDDFGSEWKYIPIRRLALFIEESLFRGTKWVVFEPNDEPLWAKIRLNVGAFMKRLFREGAFQGDTPDKAYYVKCDSETTNQDDRNRGIVNIQVGFAPPKPAEFVVITIQQIAGDL